MIELMTNNIIYKKMHHAQKNKNKSINKIEKKFNIIQKINTILSQITNLSINQKRKKQKLLKQMNDLKKNLIFDFI